MKALTIRPGVSDDIPVLMKLDHHYSTDHVWQMAVDSHTGEIMAAFREIRLPRPMRVTYPRDASRLAEEWNQRAALLVAEADHGLSGYISLIVGPAPDAAWITDLAVSLPHRRQGVASRLLGAARSWSQEQHLARMYIEMQSKNYPAICLVRKLGFVFSGYSDGYYPDQDIALFFRLEIR